MQKDTDTHHQNVHRARKSYFIRYEEFHALSKIWLKPYSVLIVLRKLSGIKTSALKNKCSLAASKTLCCILSFEHLIKYSDNFVSK